MRRPTRLCGLALAGILGGGVVVWASSSDARPGGGHSFGGGGGGSSGGGHSSGSSGGSHSSSSSSHSGSSSSGPSVGSGMALLLLVVIGGPLVALRLALERESETSSWDMGPDPTPEALFVAPAPNPVRLERLRKYDANFSEIALEDYLHELYTRAMRARTSDEELALLAPYLSAEVRGALRTRGRRDPAAVGGIVVGSCNIVALHVGREPIASIDVAFETNYEETSAGGQRLGFWARERWTLQRSIAATSRPPNEVRTFGCPSCGAPVEQDQREACGHCGTRWDTNDFEWQCTKIRLTEESPRPPTVGGYSEEQGTFSATKFDAGSPKIWESLAVAGISETRDTTRARVGEIHRKLNEAWSQLAWDDAKSICTDRFWLSQTYWIEAYAQSQMRNRMEQARLQNVEFVRLRVDPFFAALTVRIHAEAIDTTVHVPTGQLVGGNPLEPRAYTEYWTLVRPVADASASKSCPACGAALQTNAAGNCEHCGAKVVGGASDWVLSKIEQDEAYLG